MTIEVGSIWDDTYVLQPRLVEVTEVTSVGVHFRERAGLHREFYVVTGGFLSRFIPYEDQKIKILSLKEVGK